MEIDAHGTIMITNTILSELVKQQSTSQAAGLSTHFMDRIIGSGLKWHLQKVYDKKSDIIEIFNLETFSITTSGTSLRHRDSSSIEH